MYSIDEITHAVKNPSAVQHELLRHTLFRPRPEGVNLLNEDWDTLIILDACRYDIFKDSIGRMDLTGELSSKPSLGSATKEWVRNTFKEREEHDLVYVTANGWLKSLREDINSSLYDSYWLTGEEYRNSAGTVDPEDVTDVAIEAHNENPNKRLIIHYVQPHAPYIQSGREYFEEMPGLTVNEFVQLPEVTNDLLRRAYRETLDSVLEEVRRLLNTIDGKSVISADHGEMLGERKPPFWMREYGHPLGVYYDELVTVPWFEVTHEQRRTIISEEPKETRSADDEELMEHLDALGYGDHT
ncbi:hypothetical protein [Haloterrigena salinisoli]|uniref:hypothetical protein n=1 Tax=Haloterrigena salinisoli TaxID=3132747 RepID=UPI0030D2845C